MSDLIDRSKLPTIRITIPTHACTELVKHIVEIVAEGYQTMLDSVPAVDAVPRDEYEALLKRFRHLLESDYIRSFDEYDPRTQTYKRDIAEADAVASPVRCEHCHAWYEDMHKDFANAGFCIILARHTRPNFYCAYGNERREND